MTLFTLTDVTLDVPGRRLIDNLSLDIAAGAVTALVGRNGSSKSTLLKLLAAQNRPSAGRITHSGRDLSLYPARDLARRIAYLLQVTPPADGMRLSELVALGRYPWRAWPVPRRRPHRRCRCHGPLRRAAFGRPPCRYPVGRRASARLDRHDAGTGSETLLPDAPRLCLGGDETALPVLARILESVPQETAGQALIEVADDSDIQPLRTPPGLHLHWLRRGRDPSLRAAFTEIAAKMAASNCGTTILFGGEKSDAQSIRSVLRGTDGSDRACDGAALRLSVAAYWIAPA